MFELKILAIVFALKNLLIPTFKEKSCSGFRFQKKKYKIENVGFMPDSVKESSGIEICEEGISYWTLGDGGSKSQLFEVDQCGKVRSVLPLHQLPNFDWEEMARDAEGNIYIGEFGNNRNRRTDLKIYKINLHDNNRIDTISFRYPDQTAFPPDRKNMNFDCEGMFWHRDSLYLFSKNRGKKWMKIYRLPDEGGEYTAAIQQKIYVGAQVTAADISPDNQLVALLAYGKIYFLKVSEGAGFKLIPYFKRKFNASGQAEALVFINPTDILVSNEERQLFMVYRKRKKDR